MRPFVFRWQRMLRLAEGFERDRRNALAGAVGALTRAEDLLTQMQGKRQQLMEKRSFLLSHGVLIDDVQDNYQGELQVGFRIDMQREHIVKCQEKVDERREELTEKMRERKTYEKLRERAWKRYGTEFNREESRVADDVGAISFERTRGNDFDEISSE